ncbi:hypothetical protein EXIGLDRAFT_846386 [Exidia glandulosa HHB12029]|uniref:Uncharacterized protein n=1 Tax=Exidia glandulosa HHB12029 TaxID=1314781 RepID=A0A165B051_EXIGL|nr:hypothetical protein EXIGLDRAFT_846386 [Exidia glandulosa HHB12029]
MNTSGTDEPRKIASVKRMSALLRPSTAETGEGISISSTSAPICNDVARGESKVACTDNGKPTIRFALSASTAARVTFSSTRPTTYAVKKAVVEDSDVKYAKAVLEATNEKIRADKLESQVNELLKRARTTDSDAIRVISEHETVIFGLRTELEAKEKQVLELQEQLAVANTAAASATQEARQERDFHERRADSSDSEKALDEALIDNAELKNLCRMNDAVHQWMVMLIGALTFIGIMLGVLCYCLMSQFVF